MAASYISRGHHAVTPYLVVKGVDKLIDFLKQNYTAMPRTALRYAIERFPKAQRKRMLSGAFG